MSFFHKGQGDQRAPEAEVLPDGRKRLTCFKLVASLAAIAPQLADEYGALHPSDSEAPTGWTGLRLVDRRVTDDAAPAGRDTRPVRVLVYEQIPATDEIQVGGNTQIQLEDGRTAIEANFLQFVGGPYVPGTVGVTTAPGDTSAFLQRAEQTNDGTQRRIKRTYVYAGTISTDDESLQGGALLKKTIVSVKTVPSTPSGYTLIDQKTDSPNGFPVYTYTFAKGLGTVLDASELKEGGKIVVYHRIKLGAVPATPTATLAGTVTLLSSSVRNDDGNDIYDYTWAEGIGEISREVTYAQSSDQGTTGVTRTVIRYLTASSVTSDPTTLANNVKVGEEKTDQDGYRIWTITYAKGTGLVVDETEFKEGNALTVFHRVAIGGVPTTPGGASGALSSIIITNGGSGYTSAPTVAITGGGGTGATATAVISGGVITSLTLSNGGSGYTSAPTIALTSGGGSGGAATAVLATRAVSSIAVSAAGSGYTAVPTVALTGGGGSGGTATAVLTATTVGSINLTNAGSGYTSAPTVALTGGGGTGATATATVVGGTVTGLSLTNAGSGYTSAPTLSFSGGSGGSGATATAALTGTSIASIAVTAAGSGYTSAPTVALTGGGGTGAAGTAVLAGAAVTSLTLTNAGNSYTNTPAVGFSGGSGTGAVATAGMSSGVGGLSITAGGSGYSGNFTISFSGGGGSGASAFAYVSGGAVIGYTILSEGFTYTSAPTPDFSAGSGTGAAATALLLGCLAVVPNITNGGSGYATAPTVSFSGGGGTGAAATALVSGGAVIGFRFTNGGSGYTSAPTISFSGGGGSGAAATASRQGTTGVVDSLTLTNGGSGYTSAPTIGFTGGGGSGAAATATLASTTVASVSVSNGGSGYTSAPTIGLSGGGGSGATASATLTGTTIASLSLTAGGSGYNSVPTLVFTGGGGSGAAGTASTAGVTITGIVVTGAGSGYTSVPTVGFSGGGGTGATATAALTATTIASFSVSATGSGYTSAPTVGLSGGGGGTGGAGTVTLTTAAVASLTLTNSGSGYTSSPTLGFSGGGGSGAAGTAAVGTSSVTSVTLTAAGSGYTSSPTIGFTGGSGTGAAATAPAGGVVTLVSANVRKEAGFDLYDYTWAQGIGEISRETNYAQSSAGDGSVGSTTTTIRALTSLTGSDPTSAPSGTVKVSTSSTAQDAYLLWTVVYAKGTGVVGEQKIPRSDGLMEWHRTVLSADALPLTVSTFNTSWLPTANAVLGPLHSSLDSGYTVTEAVWFVAGDGTSAPTSATVASEAWVPFRYPGQAKYFSQAVTVSGVGTTHCKDVFLSPPVEVLVLATTTISYQTGSTVGSLTNALWNPTQYATLIAAFAAWQATPRSIVKGLEGYTAINAGASGTAGGSGFDTCVMGERVYASSDWSIALSGGPTMPNGSTVYTLHAEVEKEPVFVKYDGTKYYRKIIVTATPAALTALPV